MLLKIEGLRPEASQLYYNETPTQAISYEIDEIFKTTYLEEHLQMIVSRQFLKPSDVILDESLNPMQLGFVFMECLFMNFIFKKLKFLCKKHFH